MNIDESASEVRLSAELPGIDVDDVEVTLDGGVIRIAGTRKVEREEGREGYYHVESSSGTFRRSIRLPFEADGDAVTASYKNGVLEVTINKPEEAISQARVIPVNV